MRLLELKRQKELEEEQREAAYSYKPQINNSVKAVSKILYGSTMTTQSAKVSQRAVEANEDFIQRIELSRRLKQEQEHKLMKPVTSWDSAPTKQQPFMFSQSS